MMKVHFSHGDETNATDSWNSYYVLVSTLEWFSISFNWFYQLVVNDFEWEPMLAGLRQDTYHVLDATVIVVCLTFCYLFRGFTVQNNSSRLNKLGLFEHS